MTIYQIDWMPEDRTRDIRRVVIGPEPAEDGSPPDVILDWIDRTWLPSIRTDLPAGVVEVSEYRPLTFTADTDPDHPGWSESITLDRRELREGDQS